MPLKLKWSRTWPDAVEDFVCRDGDQRVGRIYSTHKPGGEKHWLWALNGYLPDRNMWLNASGHVDAKQEAAEPLEAAYFRVLDR